MLLDGISWGRVILGGVLAGSDEEAAEDGDEDSDAGDGHRNDDEGELIGDGGGLLTGSGITSRLPSWLYE